MKENFKERYLNCRKIDDKRKMNSCIFEVLHDITELQDNIQLGIDNDVDYSTRLSMNLVNDANAIILGISKEQGDIKKFIRDFYVEEKVESTIKHWNYIVHDYNIIVENLEDVQEKIDGRKYTDRNVLADKETREWQKKYLFGEKND